MLLRSSEGSKAYASGLMKSVSNVTDYAQPSEYKIEYGKATVSNDSPTAIKLDFFSFRAKVWVASGGFKPSTTDKPATYTTRQVMNSDVGLQADIDLREGQKVVVGKVNVGDSNTCFFIVLSARLVP